MHHIQLNDRLYEEAQRRAREAGFASVDEFVADRLEGEFSGEQEDFDGQFTPELMSHLDRLSDEMKAGNSVSTEQVDQHIGEIRKAWLKDHAS
jgi:hypothetical protein